MTEHQRMEAIAASLDEKADDIFGIIANGGVADDDEAQAYRRCAEIIRYQIECEA